MVRRPCRGTPDRRRSSVEEVRGVEAETSSLEMPEAELPKFPRLPRRGAKDPSIEERVKTLKKWRQEQAARLALDPGVLINNASLEALAAANPQSAQALDEVVGLKNWQKKELGESLLATLAR
jgi:ribonuclease D